MKDKFKEKPIIDADEVVNQDWIGALLEEGRPLPEVAKIITKANILLVKLNTKRDEHTGNRNN